MRLTTRARAGLWAVCALVLTFVYVPLGVITINSFNSDRTFGWPPPSLTLKWWQLAAHAQGPRDALWTSLQAGLGATALALLLGTLLSFALTRYSFFGHQSISLLVVLPIALPGIVTGVALQSVIQKVLSPSSVSAQGCSRSSSDMRLSASWSSSTTSRQGSGDSGSRWRQPPPTSGHVRPRPSGW